jgi:hypothetical protein
MSHRKNLLLGTYVGVVLMVGCARSVELLDQDGRSMMAPAAVYTLTNLHPDNQRSRLYAVNFLQPGLIPVCSRVEVLELKGDLLRFRVLKTGRTYDYINHKAAAEPFEDHLRRFFGLSCPAEEIERLSDIDRKGIKKGQAFPGMTKRGVVLALGLPPRHVNPDLEVDDWIYWKHRFNRIRISFDENGHVSEIRN